MNNRTTRQSSADLLEQRDSLDSTLKPHWVWAIALGSAIGWGAFVLPTDWLSTAGPLGTAIGLTVGATLMCLIAVSYGILIRTFPVSGGEFAYAFNAFGRNHAFACGWFLTLGYASIVALNASAVALLFRRLLPGLVEWVPLWEIAGWQVYLGEVVVASLALVAFAVLNTRGTALSGRTQFLMVMAMLVGVALILVGVLIHPDGMWANVSPGFPEGVAPTAAILGIVAIAPWAFVGFDNVPQAAEEFDFPPAKAFALIVFAIVAAAAIYIAMTVATAASQKWEGLVASEPLWGTADGLSNLFGSVGLLVLGLSVAMGVSTGLNGFYVAASRLLFAMGRARVIPERFAGLNSHRAPGFAVVFVMAVCLLSPWFGRQALSWIVDMSSIGVTIAYTYTCLAAFKMLRWSNAPADPTEPEGSRSTVRKVLALLGALAGVCFLLLLLVPGSPAALKMPSLIALGVWVALGLVFWVTRRKAVAATSEEEMRTLILGEHLEKSDAVPSTTA
ncbi:APC family permease [Kytococcus sedentarius]|uniref:APC family permease n=1 Tax=Kytococcus sedentarius TaxID=1276 RepID=UPI00194EE95D|nr:APC family permease [Kytococcus sedentarius]QRO86926.1 APC family permease [Kytococcus sedentarius]